VKRSHSDGFRSTEENDVYSDRNYHCITLKGSSVRSYRPKKAPGKKAPGVCRGR